MKIFAVQLNERSYPIYIGSGLLRHAELLCKHITGRQALIVTNTTIAPLYLPTVRAALSAYQTDTVILPDGEQYKTLATTELIFDQLLHGRFDRDTTLLALGGGVIGDITGFAAACYQRGVNFIQIPTTLLAQVDSSVGGKTGVNHPMGKNMIGAFHQPRCVIIDIDTLKTLPARELSAGIAEIIKYGLIRDREFFDWLEDNIHRLLNLEHDVVIEAVARSCENKAKVVAEDEHERSGARALLNFGHTFGHAIETGTGYGSWLHGEAVACGMLIAAKFSARLGWIEEASVARIRSLLRASRLPLLPPKELTPNRFIDLMGVDKKVKNGKLRLVLLRAIGEAVITDAFEHSLLYTTLSEISNAA